MGVLALSTILISSCEVLDKGEDISFEATLEETIEITELNAGTNVSYLEIIVLDASSDPDIYKYKDKIKGFTVEKVSLQIPIFEFGLSTSAFSGIISFGDVTSSLPRVVATVTNLNFQTAYSYQTTYDLPINQSDLDQIAHLLDDDKAVKIFLSGTLSDTPIAIDVRVILEVSVNADAL